MQTVRVAIVAYAAKGEAMAHAFDAFQALVYPGAPADQLRELKISFMAGASELLSIIMAVMEQGEDVTDADLAVMDNISNELAAFHQGVIDTASAGGRMQ
jgi:hypothetical protein